MARGGATLREVRASQLAFLAHHRPDLVTLSAGANDATHFVPETEFSRDLKAILTALRASSARRVLIAKAPDLFLAPALPLPLSIATQRGAKRQNQLLKQEIEAFLPPNRLQIVDLFGRGPLDARRDPQLYAADSFHPSARGYEVWAQLFIEKLSISGAANRPVNHGKGRFTP